jgi:hypothetical protein
MTDTNFFRLIGLVQLLVAGVCFYTAATLLRSPEVFTVAVSALCMITGVITTVIAGKLMGLLK